MSYDQKACIRIFDNSRRVEQKRSTLLSSRGASTSSRTQIGAGFVKNAENIKARAVKACSPPEVVTLFAVFYQEGSP